MKDKMIGRKTFRCPHRGCTCSQDDTKVRARRHLKRTERQTWRGETRKFAHV